jgi:squalene synthase HpnC
MLPLREASSAEPNTPKSLKSPPRSGESLVLNDLARFGPDCHGCEMSVPESESYCKNLALNHYENFSVASFLLPKSIRQDFYNIYAYCRWSDDLADETPSQATNSSSSQIWNSVDLLEWWRNELRQCFAGNSKHPVFVALRSTLLRHPLPIEPFEKLLDAFCQDQHVNRYQSDEEVLAYCSGSANPVGRILLGLAKTTQADAIRQSDLVCTGLQLANFCQDIRKDALRNRIYLPQSRWTPYSISQDDILQGTKSAPLQNALRDWVYYAREHLVQGLPLVEQVPRWLARDVQLFVRGGLTILENIERAGFDVWNRPIEVTKSQKLMLLGKSILFPRSIRTCKLPGTLTGNLSGQVIGRPLA